MAALSKSAYVTKYNDAGSGIYRDGQPAGSITEADTRDDVLDTSDSAMFLSDNFIDEDSFATDSAVKAPSQQSTKAYVDDRVRITTVSVSSAEILNLNSAPKSLIAAPGANLFIEVLDAHVFYDYNSIVYATSTGLYLQIGTSSATSTAVTSILNQAQDMIASFERISYVATSASILNKALFLHPDTASNPTAGNGTLKVFVTYRLVSIV